MAAGRREGNRAPRTPSFKKNRHNLLAFATGKAGSGGRAGPLRISLLPLVFLSTGRVRHDDDFPRSQRTALPRSPARSPPQLRLRVVSGGRGIIRGPRIIGGPRRKRSATPRGHLFLLAVGLQCRTLCSPTCTYHDNGKNGKRVVADFPQRLRADFHPDLPEGDTKKAPTAPPTRSALSLNH